MLLLLAPLATTLEVLKLGGNSLRGSITSDIAHFTRLRTLELNSMGLQGWYRSPYTNVLRPPVILFRRFDSFSGDLPNELGNLINLTSLNLEENQLTGDMQRGGIYQLSRLMHLVLAKNCLSGNNQSPVASLQINVNFDPSQTTTSRSQANFPPNSEL